MPLLVTSEADLETMRAVLVSLMAVETLSKTTVDSCLGGHRRGEVVTDMQLMHAGVKKSILTRTLPKQKVREKTIPGNRDDNSAFSPGRRESSGFKAHRVLEV